MKRSSIVAVIALTGWLTCGAFAQDARPERPTRPGAGGAGQAGGGAAAREQMQRMEQELNLTSEQRTKIQEARRAQTEKARALREDTSLTQQERQEKMRALREDNQATMKKILTAEQFEKWTKLQSEQPARRGAAGGRGGPGGLATPPPERK